MAPGVLRCEDEYAEQDEYAAQDIRPRTFLGGGILSSATGQAILAFALVDEDAEEWQSMALQMRCGQE